MILLCGIPSEAPLALVAEALRDLDEPFLVFNQRHFSVAHIEFTVQRSQVEGVLVLDGQKYPLAEIRGMYNRLMDEQALPELQALPPEDLERGRCRCLHQALIDWMEIAPGQVVNRMSAMGSNGSKPYQMQIIRSHGFAIPESLVTNNPELVRAFYREHERVIYKSASGVRSIVASLKPEDFARLERIRWCPTLFQKQVVGENLRVHVIGERVFATRIRSDAVDYRYAGRQGNPVELEAVEINEQLGQQCVRLADSLGLAFAGIDLMLTDEGVYCFEVNPNPGFSYYEGQTGQPIAEAVARYLVGRQTG